MGGSEAYTHLELAAIFAAFVAVTTLFSLVSLGASVMDIGSSSDPGAYPFLIAGEPHLAPVGEVTFYGFPGRGIDTLSFCVIHTGEGRAVDLSRVTVTVMAGTYLEILAPSTDPAPGPGTWSAALPGGGTLLFPGEEGTIRLRLDHPAPMDEALTILVRPEGSAPCSITGLIRIPAADTDALSSPEKD